MDQIKTKPQSNISSPNGQENLVIDHQYQQGTSPVIQAQHVIKDFLVGESNIKIIKDVSLEIYPGEFVIVYGPSGCGKSTLLNIINGWEEPTSGKVYILGNDIYAVNEDQRVIMCRQIMSMVHQSANWVKSLSVIENIIIPHILAGYNRKESYERAIILLKLLNLEKFKDYRPMDLSGGQQQRISILRALINNPQIIIADEPTGNLDTTSSHVLMDLFLRINQKLNRTIIIVTHSMNLLKMASKTINIIDGKIVGIAQNKNQINPTGKLGDVIELATKSGPSFQEVSKEAI